MRKKKLITLALAALFLLQGCGSNELKNEIVPLGENENRIERLSMLEEGVVEYETMEMLPSIIVSLSGYETGHDKVAILESKRFPATFQVIDSQSGKVVYIGNVEARECSEDDILNSAVADFSDLDEPGRYYISTEMLGRSKDFFISDTDRKNRVINVFKSIHSSREAKSMGQLLVDSTSNVYVNTEGGWITDKSGGKDVLIACNTVMDMLLAYELHPKVFTDDFGTNESGNLIPDFWDELIYEAKWLIKMQNPDTGGVYSGVYIPEGKSMFYVGGEATRTTAYFCATMARLSSDMARIDAQLSRDCLQAATRAFDCLSSNKEIVTAEQMFMAAVEMYKITGQATYLSVINDFLSTAKEMDYENRAMLDAAMTYMNTSRLVNVDFCTRLMQQFMARTEEKSNAALSSRFYVEPEKSLPQLLRNATELIVADNIISNQEYENIETNYLYYLSGRNHECLDYTKTLENVNQYAQLLVLVTELADKNH